MAGPLEGVKVVELGVWVAGPAAGGILADWGAEVVKIEPPAGDPSRTFQYSLTGQMMPTNPIFEMDNRSKRSIVLDLTTPEGKEIADDLIAGADVFVTNVRLGGLERLGLDAETLTTRHPRLIYAAITGYGMEGEDADRAAYDIAAFWSRSGIAHLLTRPGEDPPFQRGGMGDHNAGLAGAAAVCAALYSRENRRGPVGVDLIAARGALHDQLRPVGTAWLGTHAPDRPARVDGQCCDEQLLGERRQALLGGRTRWHAALAPLARAVGREDWLDDERYADPRNRARNAAEIIAQLDEIFATKTMAEWEEVFATNPTSSGHRSTAPTTCSPTRSSMHPARSSKCPTARAPRT